jgi:hypothetical protein
MLGGRRPLRWEAAAMMILRAVAALSRFCSALSGADFDSSGMGSKRSLPILWPSSSSSGPESIAPTIVWNVAVASLRAFRCISAFHPTKACRPVLALR